MERNNVIMSFIKRGLLTTSMGFPGTHKLFRTVREIRFLYNINEETGLEASFLAKGSWGPWIAAQVSCLLLGFFFFPRDIYPGESVFGILYVFLSCLTQFDFRFIYSKDFLNEKPLKTICTQ